MLSLLDGGHFTHRDRRLRTRRRPRPAGRFTPALEGLEARVVLSGGTAPGMEIAYIGSIGADAMGPTGVYLAGGTNPIPTDVWPSYTPPSGYIKNTDRNVEFDSADFLTSPDSTTGVTYITTSDGYTWKFVTETVSANYPFNPKDYPGQHYTNGYEAAALEPTPPPGVIRYSANTKNAVTTWLARDANDQPILRYFIRDNWGSVYIMQSSAAANEADVKSNFETAVLPAGWTLYSGYLQSDLTTSPAYDSQGFAQFNIFRDSADDAFQQITWSARGLSIAQHIPNMTIWGGPSADTISGNPQFDNLIHGAQGNDTILAVGPNDTIYGDDGTDSAVFSGKRSQYIVSAPAGNSSTVTVARKATKGRPQVATLHDVEFLRFTDGTVSTAPGEQSHTVHRRTNHRSPKHPG